MYIIESILTLYVMVRSVVNLYLSLSAKLNVQCIALHSTNNKNCSFNFIILFLAERVQFDPAQKKKDDKIKGRQSHVDIIYNILHP